VMDGHFVPNLSFGPPMVAALHERTGLYCDVHLMVERPEELMEAYVKAGASSITIHAEATRHLHRSLGWVRSLGVRSGVSVNPGTPLEAVQWVLDEADLLLVMTVNPGFGGQAFIEAMLPKIARARRMIDEAQTGTLLEVDGGIDVETVRAVTEAGADVLVVGSALYRDPEGVGAAVRKLRDAIRGE